jgi:hypothetical protein
MADTFEMGGMEKFLVEFALHADGARQCRGSWRRVRGAAGLRKSRRPVGRSTRWSNPWDGGLGCCYGWPDSSAARGSTSCTLTATGR